MKILFACGGTAGHINPALATANYIRSRYPDAPGAVYRQSQGAWRPVWCRKPGYDFAPVELQGASSGGFAWRDYQQQPHRSMELLCHLPGQESARSSRQFQPDVVVGTGGYVSGPVLRKAVQMGVQHRHP